MENTYHPKRNDCIWVLVFFVCVFLITSAGRMAGADPHSQLQAAVALAVNGRLGLDTKVEPELYWVKSPSGLFYQAHDPGNLALFFPLALVTRAKEGPRQDLIANPPLMLRVAVALQYAILGGICATVIWAILAFQFPPQTSFMATAILCLGTPFWIYTRATLDVLGGALGVALILLSVMAHTKRRLSAESAGLLAGLFVAGACWFRFSMLPFLLPTTLAVLWINETRRKPQAAVAFLASVTLGLVPVFAYNQIRLGNPFTPATRAAQYEFQNGLDGNLFEGLYGLLLAPNHGLLVFAPVLLMAILAPARLRRRSREERVVVFVYTFAVAAYILLIAKLKQWGKVEWGPRYLVPMLPIMGLLATYGGIYLWRCSRLIVGFLVVLSLAVTLPAVVVNYSLVIVQSPETSNPSTPYPAQLMGSYSALAQGLSGRDLVLPAETQRDPERSQGARFPDLWTARLMEKPGSLQFAGIAIVIALILAIGYSSLRLWRLDEERDTGHPTAQSP